MRNLFLTTAIFPVALALASCGAAQSEDNLEVAAAAMSLTGGTAYDLDDGSPFLATAHGELKEGWAIAFEPGTNNIFITEKGGTAKMFVGETGKMLEVTGLPESTYIGQGGLGDVAFAPDYATSGTIYLSWVKADEGDKTRAVAGMGTLACDGESCTISDFRQIWQQEPAIESFGHFSHKMAISPDGQYLFITSGDRTKQDPAQDLATNLGKVLRLNLDGTPAEGNPFADQGSPTDQIWSYGHRNLLGLKFDPDGQLWNVEHGPAGGDEFNRVDEAANYGWPVRSDGENYNGDPIPNHSADDGFSKPAISWNPVIAPGDFIFYNGEMFADWQGDPLIANLGTQTIVRLDTDATAGTASEEARYEFPMRLRDIAQGPDGAIWVIEDGTEGNLLRLTPAATAAAE